MTSAPIRVTSSDAPSSVKTATRVSVWFAPTALAGARSEPMLGPFVDDSRHITATGPRGLVNMRRRPGLTPSAVATAGWIGWPDPRSTSALTGIASRISLSPFRKPRDRFIIPFGGMGKPVKQDGFDAPVATGAMKPWALSSISPS
jgi:hypothetical protein